MTATRACLSLLALAPLLAAAGCFDLKLGSMENFACGPPQHACPAGYACYETPQHEFSCHKTCQPGDAGAGQCTEGYVCQEYAGIVANEALCIQQDQVQHDGGPRLDGTQPEAGPEPDGNPPVMSCEQHYEVGGLPNLPEGKFDIAAGKHGVYVVWIRDTGDLVLARPDASGVWASNDTFVSGPITRVAAALDDARDNLHLIFVRQSDESRLVHCALHLPLPISPGLWACAEGELHAASGTGAVIANLDLDSRDGVIAAALQVGSTAGQKMIFAQVVESAGYTLQQPCVDAAISDPVAHPRVAARLGQFVGSYCRGTAQPPRQWHLFHPNASTCGPTPTIGAGDALSPGALTIDGDQAFFAGATAPESPPIYATWPVDAPGNPQPQSVPMGNVLPVSLDIAWLGGPIIAGIPNAAGARPLHPPLLSTLRGGTWRHIAAPDDTLGHTQPGNPGLSVRLARQDSPSPFLHVAYHGKVLDSGGDPVNGLFYFRCSPALP